MPTSPPDVKVPDTFEEFLEMCPEQPDTPEQEAPAEEVGASFVPLVIADRCARCGAQARVRGRLPSGREIDFCKHHFELHGPALHEQGLEVLDDQPLRALYEEDRKKGEL